LCVQFAVQTRLHGVLRHEDCLEDVFELFAHRVAVSTHRDVCEKRLVSPLYRGGLGFLVEQPDILFPERGEVLRAEESHGAQKKVFAVKQQDEQTQRHALNIDMKRSVFKRMWKNEINTILKNNDKERKIII